MVKVWKSDHNLKILDWVLGWLLWMIIQGKTSRLLDRETPRGSKDIPKMETLTMLAIKQELQGSVMSSKAVVPNQQEVSVAI